MKTGGCGERSGYRLVRADPVVCVRVRVRESVLRLGLRGRIFSSSGRQGRRERKARDRLGRGMLGVAVFFRSDVRRGLSGLCLLRMASAW